MQNERRATARELRDGCLRRARVLERASRRQAAAQDGVGALVLEWAADVAVVQAVLLERLVLEAQAPQRKYFGLIEKVAQSLRDIRLVNHDEVTAATVLGALRDRVYANVDREVARDIAGRVTDSAYLAGFAAPTAQEIGQIAGRRLQGLTPSAFVAQRKREAAELMVEAQSQRMRGDVARAIQAAYDSDFRSLEAYLVDSAVAAGDDGLLTVDARWELAAHAMGEVPGLPADFVGAVAAVRGALAVGLGEPDATRLAAMLPTV